MAAAWAEVSANKSMIRRAFEKCGISVPIDGSGDQLINIKGLSDYTVEEDEGLYEMDTDNDSDEGLYEMDTDNDSD